MTLYEVIQMRERSQDARAKTLYWLRHHLDGLGAESQVRVVRELIGDLRKSLREYQKHKVAPIPNLKNAVPMPVKAVEDKSGGRK
ncbi:MAG TPA: hypothetical protein VKD24_01455 [Candidatus Angelobacter sp.]|nr:hypothetical protein [Candidatus Angelobacter sp.]